MLNQFVQHAASFATQVSSTILWLVLLTLVFVPIERLFTLRQRGLNRGQLAGDIAYYFLNSILPTILLSIPLGLVASLVSRATPQAYIEAINDLPLWLRIVAGLLIGDLGAYWAHRVTHRSNFLWRFHKVHHAPEHIDWLVNTRAHPVDIAFTRLCGLVPIYALSLASPATPEGSLVPFIVSYAGVVWAFFIHANVRWRLGPLEWIVASPAFHHWHHTNDEHRDHNYAAMFPIYDRLFGTHHLPDHWPPCYGVDEPQPASMVGQLLRPLGLDASAPPAKRSETPAA